MADTYTVVRSVTIDAEPEDIYPWVADFHAWPRWSPWEDIDPAMQRTYSGPESGTGASYAWFGNRKAGSGSMEITRAEPWEHVVIDLRFVKPFKARNETGFRIEPQGSGRSVVTWTMTGRATVATRVMSVFSSMDKLIGKDFDKGLSRLKSAAEAGRPPA